MLCCTGSKDSNLNTSNNKVLRMKCFDVWTRVLTIGVALSLASTVYATEYQGSGQVVFEGSSTLHGFSGAVPLEHLIVKLEQSSPDPIKMIEAEASVSVLKMNTQNSGRDKKMRAMFGADQWPTISGRIPPSKVDLDQFRGNKPQPTPQETSATPNTTTGEPLKLALTIRNKTVDLPVQLWGFQELPDGSISIAMSFNVSLQSFQLKPPTVMGLIRVADLVRIHAELVLRPIETSQP